MNKFNDVLDLTALHFLVNIIPVGLLALFLSQKIAFVFFVGALIFTVPHLLVAFILHKKEAFYLPSSSWLSFFYTLEIVKIIISVGLLFLAAMMFSVLKLWVFFGYLSSYFLSFVLAYGFTKFK